MTKTALWLRLQRRQRLSYGGGGAAVAVLGFLAHQKSHIGHQIQKINQNKRINQIQKTRDKNRAYYDVTKISSQTLSDAKYI